MNTATFATLAMVLVLFCMGVNSLPAIAETEGTKSKCHEAKEVSNFAARPSIIWGMAFDFEGRVLRAFPVGSCEQAFTNWMNELGFGVQKSTYSETAFASVADEFARAETRRNENRLINRRELWRSAPVGNSYFSIAWNTDKFDRISEIFVDTEFFHIDLP